MSDLIKFGGDDAISKFPVEKQENLRRTMGIMVGSDDDIDIDDSELRAPQLKIVHGIQLADVNAVPAESVLGDIFTTPTMVTLYRMKPGKNDPASMGKAIRLRPLLITQSHLLYNKPEKRTECASVDGRFSAMRNMECKNCPDSPGFENGRPKPCQKIYTMYVIAADLSGIYSITMKSYNNAVAVAVANQTRGRGKKLCEIAWDLSVVIKEQGPNKIPIFSMNIANDEADITEAEFELCSSIAGNFKDMHTAASDASRASAANFAVAMKASGPTIDPGMFLPPSGTDDMNDM